MLFESSNFYFAPLFLQDLSICKAFVKAQSLELATSALRRLFSLTKIAQAEAVFAESCGNLAVYSSWRT